MESRKTQTFGRDVGHRRSNFECGAKRLEVESFCLTLLPDVGKRLQKPWNRNAQTSLVLRSQQSTLAHALTATHRDSRMPLRRDKSTRSRQAEGRTHKIWLLSSLFHMADGTHKLRVLQGGLVREWDARITGRSRRTERAVNQFSAVRTTRTPLVSDQLLIRLH
jgi:hypothetical protein